MDKLDRIFEMQASLDKGIYEKRNIDVSNKSVMIQRKILAIISELSEVLDEVNFKWWKNPKEVNDNALRDELIDVLHFFVSACQDAGMDANELFGRYIAKNIENHRRQNGLSEKKGYCTDEQRSDIEAV